MHLLIFFCIISKDISCLYPLAFYDTIEKVRKKYRKAVKCMYLHHFSPLDKNAFSPWQQLIFFSVLSMKLNLFSGFFSLCFFYIFPVNLYLPECNIFEKKHLWKGRGGKSLVPTIPSKYIKSFKTFSTNIFPKIFLLSYSKKRDEIFPLLKGASQVRAL